MSMAAWPSMEPASPSIGLVLGQLDQPLPEEQSEEHGDGDDHDRPPDELGGGELPAEQEGHDDPELDHQVGRGDLEHHHGGEVGPFSEQAPGQRHRRIGARGAGDAQPGGHPEVLGESFPKSRSMVPLRTRAWTIADRREAQDQRPEDLPGHPTGHGQGMTDGMDDSHSEPSPRQANRSVGVRPA